MASNSSSSSSSSSSCVIRPGLEDASLLMIQESYVSQYIWNGHPDRVLVVRGKSSVRSRDEQVLAEIIPYLEQTGFLEIAKLEFFLIEHTLVSALVERWRPETYTFHLPRGNTRLSYKILLSRWVFVWMGDQLLAIRQVHDNLFSSNC